MLLVDDDDIARASLRAMLARGGHEVVEAQSCATAVGAFNERRPDLALLDYRLPDGNGVELVRTLRGLDRELPCLVLTGHGTIDLAVQAIKEGAEQFLTKPIKHDVLDTMVARLLERSANRHRARARDARDARDEVDPFAGRSAAIRALAEDAERIASASSPILILGETGVGKGVIARWLHRTGSRRNEPFIDLNCAGLQKELLESELFGHERGAFTGAVSAKQGLIEMAHRGILFLDEIGDMDLTVQPKLLKVLEEKRFRRVGEVREREVSIRLIAATHHDLGARVNEGGFRRDLYFRVGTLPLLVPPLRERREDLPDLARALAKRIGQELGRPDVRISDEAIDALARHSWPGNVRELKNLVERAILLCDGDLVGARELRFRPDDSVVSTSGRDLTLAQVERRHIELVLDDEGGNVERAAMRLGIPRSSLYSKLSKMGITQRARTVRG